MNKEIRTFKIIRALTGEYWNAIAHRYEVEQERATLFITIDGEVLSRAAKIAPCTIVDVYLFDQL